MSRGTLSTIACPYLLRLDCITDGEREKGKAGHSGGCEGSGCAATKGPCGLSPRWQPATTQPAPPPAAARRGRAAPAVERPRGAGTRQRAEPGRQLLTTRGVELPPGDKAAANPRADVVEMSRSTSQQRHSGSGRLHGGLGSGRGCAQPPPRRHRTRR